MSAACCLAPPGWSVWLNRSTVCAEAVDTANAIAVRHMPTVDLNRAIRISPMIVDVAALPARVVLEWPNHAFDVHSLRSSVATSPLRTDRSLAVSAGGHLLLAIYVRIN